MGPLVTRAEQVRSSGRVGKPLQQQEPAEHPSWAARKAAKQRQLLQLSGQAAPKRIKFDDSGERCEPKAATAGQQSGGASGPSVTAAGPRKGRAHDDLHPSWAARKQAQQARKLQMREQPKAKKIVFD